MKKRKLITVRSSYWQENYSQKKVTSQFELSMYLVVKRNTVIKDIKRYNAIYQQMYKMTNKTQNVKYEHRIL